MEQQVRNYLQAKCMGTGPVAALRALHNLFGMTGSEIAFQLDRDRTTIQHYLKGKEMPAGIRARLKDCLADCITVARTVVTKDDSEDELLEALINRAEAISDSL